MTAQDNGGVGYCRPPQSTRWKKGQTGNPKKIRRHRPTPIWRVIENMLNKTITVTLDGQKQKVSAFEGIVFQLWLKKLKGNRAAVRVFDKYQAFAKAMPDTFVMEDQYDEDGVNTFAESLKEIP